MITEDELTLWFIDNPQWGVQVSKSPFGRILSFTHWTKDHTVDILYLSVMDGCARPFQICLPGNVYLKNLVAWYNEGVQGLSNTPKMREILIQPASSKARLHIRLMAKNK